jgi:hypothetical protein
MGNGLHQPLQFSPNRRRHASRYPPSRKLRRGKQRITHASQAAYDTRMKVKDVKASPASRQDEADRDLFAPIVAITAQMLRFV